MRPTLSKKLRRAQGLGDKPRMAQPLVALDGPPEATYGHLRATKKDQA